MLKVFASPATETDYAFDSYLLLKNDGSNHTLTLVLKIEMVKAPTYGADIWPVGRYDNEVFFIRPWRDAAWAAWKEKFKKQAMTWANKFWLIPPANFDALDVKVGGKTMRPSIYCHLYIEFTGAGRAHRKIEVLNLDREVSAVTTNRANPPDSGFHPSDEKVYDNLDTVPRENEAIDETGRLRHYPNFMTIVHEVGHALGMDHIGVLNGDPLCALAITLWKDPDVPASSIPALYKKGKNSKICYGHFRSSSTYANIMGGGSSIEPINGKPWKDRMAYHTGTQPDAWTVTMTAKDARPKEV